MAESNFSLADAVVEAYKRHWTLTNTFRVEITWADDKARGNIGTSEVGWSNEMNSKFNLNVVNITTPQYSASQNDIFVADRWKTSIGRNEIWRFSITIRDENYMFYHRAFTKTFLMQNKLYFDECKMNVVIYKLPDYYGEQEAKIYEFKDCLVESVGSVTFDSTADSNIAQFTVNFKCIKPDFADVV